MAGLSMGGSAQAGFVLLSGVFFLAIFLGFGTCSASPSCPVTTERVRDLSNAQGDSYGRPGLSHLTIAGALLHGLKEVEIWLQTIAPGGGTPVHRHDLEEVFVILRGEGTLYLAPTSDAPGKPREFKIRANSTFSVSFNEVHQIRNNNPDEDFQQLAIITRPPMRMFVYRDWQSLHMEPRAIFPQAWDAELVNSPVGECGTPLTGVSYG